LDNSSNTPWDISASLGSVVQAGNATLSWIVGGGQFTMGPYQGAAPSKSNQFNIWGTNPTPTDVLTYTALPNAPWFAIYVFNHESGLNGEFNLPSQSHGGEPSWGTPCGFGVGQLDPPRQTADVWNWQTNVQDAISTMRTNLNIAQVQWRATVNAYNAYLQSKPAGPTPPPCDQNGAGCAEPPESAGHKFLLFLLSAAQHFPAIGRSDSAELPALQRCIGDEI
jgi:hypothetical protein